MSEGVKVKVEIGEPLNKLVCAVLWEWENVDGASIVGLDGPPTLRLKVEPIADPHGVLHQPEVSR